MGMISLIGAESALTHVTLIDDGGVSEFLVGAETVEGFFREAGITHNRSDRISHSLEALLWDGMTVSIEREVSFYVQIDGETQSRAARLGTTVSEVMRRIQQELDTALVYSGYAYAQIGNNDTLRFSTFRSRLETEYISLPYITIENHTGAVPRGRQHLRIDGVEGTKAITTAVTYIAGIEDNREVVNTEIIFEPIDAILDIGTAWLGSLTNTNSPDFHYYRRLRMEATAYTAYYCCTNKHPDDPWFGITASGRRVEHGIVAVDRSIIPLGTRLYVEGYGFAIAADVGGAIRGYKIDLYMSRIEDALQFGRRHIYVWVLDNIF
jgi:3D (Asp-Asp-Asp) domain-containing protein